MTGPEAAPVRTADWTPVATPALYDVRIGHIRSAPLHNSFTYSGYLWLVDLDDVAAGRLVTSGAAPRWLRSQLRFEAADHLGDPARSIKDNVVAFARRNGVDDVARVLMLANARSGGFGFNPLSTHWCYRADGTLACIVAEVHNTYRERHAYLLHPDQDGRAEVDKEFYVSPFNTVDGRYRMRFSAPAERMQVSIGLRQDGTTPFTAWVGGTARPATVGAVTRTVLRRPFMALRVSALIRWQGIGLWLRRLPVVPRIPHVPEPGLDRQHRDVPTRQEGQA